MTALPAETVKELGPVSRVPVQTEATAVMSLIERAARDPSVDMDKLERLMQMQERMAANRAKVAFDAALAEMQPKLPVIDRKGRIEVREKDNQGKRTGALQQSTPYALWEDINEAIRPILAAHGFSLTFRHGRSSEGLVTVTGILAHREGHREEDTFVLQHDSTGSKNAVQAVGSSNSYGKRYTAINLLNITTRGQDDDGKAAGSDPVSQEQLTKLISLADEVGADKAKFCAVMGVQGLAEIQAKDYQRATDLLNMKRKAK